MREYKFYFITTGGHITGPAVTYQASNDQEALTEAKRLLGDNDIEVWQAERIVAYIVPDK